MKETLFKAVKHAAHQNQPKQGLGTRFIPNKKKRVPKFYFKKELQWK